MANMKKRNEPKPVKIEVVYGDKRLVECMKNIIKNRKNSMKKL